MRSKRSPGVIYSKVDSFGETPVVLVWDAQHSRLEFISRQLSKCNVRLERVDAFATIRKLTASLVCGVALVGLAKTQLADEVGLEVVRSLKEGGFRVIAYGDGAASWSLSNRCASLLAGALEVLDTVNMRFGTELEILVRRMLQDVRDVFAEEKEVRSIMNGLGIVGESRAMLSVFRLVLRFSELSDLPTLITGETGTGKERLARAIHGLDTKRSNGPFIPVNCAAISPTLAESELFGHAHGAFTGAARARKGLIRAAQGGVLFLDEIGELDFALQAKLLRVVQENRVLAVGNQEEIPVDVRIIAATNRDLARMVIEKTFRSDLLQRLNVLCVHVPPLRERPSDLRPLIDHFLRRASIHLSRSVGASADFVEALSKLELHGNAREVENILWQTLAAKRDNRTLSLIDLPPNILRQILDRELGGQMAEEENNPVTAMPIAHFLEGNDWNLARSLDQCERTIMETVLRQTCGNRLKTARLLGITPRSVYNKVHKYHLF